MVLWFAHGVRRGVVTTRYPFEEPDGGTRDLPTPPCFDPDALTNDVVAELVAVCPSGALRREDDTLVYDVGACTSCGRCQAAAPDAVSASDMFELAATAREQLVKRIPLRGGSPS